MVECKYRGRVIGYLFKGADGFLKYGTYDDQQRIMGEMHLERIRALWEEYYNAK